MQSHFSKFVTNTLLGFTKTTYHAISHKPPHLSITIKQTISTVQLHLSFLHSQSQCYYQYHTANHFYQLVHNRHPISHLLFSYPLPIPPHIYFFKTHSFSMFQYKFSPKISVLKIFLIFSIFIEIILNAIK